MPLPTPPTNATSHNLRPTYNILPATADDIPGIASCLTRAFAANPGLGRISRNVDPKVQQKYSEANFRDILASADLTGAKVFVAVETGTGKIIGIARWNYPITLTPAQTAAKAALPRPASAPGTDIALRNAIFTALLPQRNARIASTRDFHMQLLGVDPDYLRLGIGTALLKRGLVDVDAAGAQCYVDATSLGLLVYLKLGWEVVDEVSVDLGEFVEGEGKFVATVLIRPPNSRR